jgi:hypothetical protein
MMSVLAVGLIAAVAQATPLWSQETTLKVTQLDVENATENAGLQYVMFSGNPTFPGLLSHHNCGDTSGWWNVGGNQAGMDALRATALAAKLADRPVRVMWVPGGSGVTSCYLGFPVIRGLQVL